MCFFSFGPPTQTLSRSGGPGGNKCISKNILHSSYYSVSTYKILWQNCFLIWRRISKFALFLSLGALPLQPRPSCLIWTTVGPYHLRMILTKFEICSLVLEMIMKMCFSPWASFPEVWTPLGAKGDCLSICLEQTIFFIYKGMYSCPKNCSYPSESCGFMINDRWTGRKRARLW